MGEEEQPEMNRLRLTGARFDGGRLPIDSLAELQKFQHVLRIAAKAKWRRAHPGEQVPADLRDSVSLTIESIEDGSADIFMAFEQHAVYAEYQAAAQDVVEAVIAAAYSSDTSPPDFPELPPEESLELRHAVAQLGGTLTPEQSIELYITSPASPPVSITVETRKRAIDNLVFEEDYLVAPDSAVSTQDPEPVQASIVGRVTIIEAENKKFTLVLADGSEVRGWYNKDPELIEDLRVVIDSTSDAPLTRVSGTLKYKDGKPSRFNPVASIEQIEFDNTLWGTRLTEFAMLLHGWDDGEGKQITSTALDAAQMLLRTIDSTQINRPGVFPTEDGGVLIEWASPDSVRSVEVTADGSFEMFSLHRGQHDGAHSETADLKQAIAFVEAETA